MTEEEAKAVIRNFLNGTSNVIEYLEALNVAEDILGINCTTSEIDKWAYERDEGVNGS